MKCFLTIFVFGLTILGQYRTASAANCLKCENCSEEITDFSISEPCDTQCAVYKSAINVNQIDRGCFESTENIVLVCSGDNCNFRRIPQCEQCTDLKTCETVACGKENDKCYAGKLDDRRGCTSDGYYDADLDGFETCETDRCNRVPSCVVCNSAKQSDANCLDKPEEFIASCPNHGIIKEENCYRQVDGDQFQLGCTSASDSPVICEGESVPCRKCEADNCNAKAFQTCYVCNNEINCPQNQLFANQVQSLPCSEYNAGCVMGYDYDTKYTLRDCSDQLPAAMLGDIVVPCDTPNCNFAEFPSHLKCYQETLGEVEFCRSPDATKCFTVDDQLGNKIRGCNTDEDFADICKELENCSVCSSDGCNEDTVPVECVICSGLDQCRNDPQRRVCEDAKFYEGCYTYLGSGSLEKGCLNELTSGGTTSDAKEACGTDNALCHKCSEPNCNAVHCLKCDSKIDDECVEGDPDAVEYEVCSPEDKCLMFKDDQGYTKRGCTSNFDAPGVETTDPGKNFGLVPSEAIKCYQCNENCDDLSDEQLKYCSRNSVLGCYYIYDGFSVTRRGCLSEEGLGCGNDQNCFDCADKDGCNAEKINECYHCTFDDSEGDCVSSGDAATCSTTGNCVVYINAEGKFVRGCENDIPPAESPTCAKPCHGDKCNNNDVCDATTDCNGICSVASAADKCLRYQNVDQVQTGCSEFRDETCGLDTEHCYACDQNLCNGEALAECYTCMNCPTIGPQTPTQLCKDIDDYCYTTKHQNGLVERGCLGDIDRKLTIYIACDGPLCNSHSLSVGNSCYQCENCGSTDGLTPSVCSAPFEGCYTAQDITDLSIYRGCVTDADFKMKCDQFNCITCEEENCNTHQVRSQPLWCSSCSGTACNEYTAPRPCREGMLVDHCIKFEMFDIATYRGCLSDKMLSHIECDCYNAKTFCQLCETDFCNSPELSCYECSSASGDGFDCITRPEVLGRTSKCHGLAYCYTRVDENTGQLSRSCANQNNVGCIEGPLCKRCQNHNCNDEAVPMGLPQLLNQPL
nr:proprotein convertase subtilisin/kexin type 5-like isoform X2 [Aedes albopictus]